MLDVRQAAMRGIALSGVLKPQDLQRFRSLLADDEGMVASEIVFSRDQERRYLMQVAIQADVMVTCQRCLEPVQEHLSSESTLAIVWTDEEGTHVPKYLEPLVVDEGPYSLWEVVEDELMLAMPAFSYHSKDDCKMKIEAYCDPVQDENPGQDKPNPFNVLAQLKPGSKQ